MDVLLIILLPFAIENAADILATVDLLDGFREWFKFKFRKIGKVVECKYCLGFWLSGVAGVTLVAFGFCAAIQVAILWLGLHRVVTLLDEFTERYMNRAPLSVFLSESDGMGEDDES
jgi:hypothetical protein